MPATLSSVRGRTFECRVSVDPAIPEELQTAKDYFHVVAREFSFTAADLRVLREQEGTYPDEAAISLVRKVIVSWDLKPGATDEQTKRLQDALDAEEVAQIMAEIDETTAQQKPIPLTPEGLAEVPVDLLTMAVLAVQRHIAERRRPNPNGISPS